MAGGTSAARRTCDFSFFLDDHGDVTADYSLDAAFDEQCTNGSSIQCTAPEPEDDITGLCDWYSGQVDHYADPVDDCTYTFTVSEVDNGE